MSDEIEFDCPFCTQTLEAPADMAGEEIDCPACGTTMTVPKHSALPPPSPLILAPADTPIVSPAQPTPCPTCGADMAHGAILCIACGYDTRTGSKLETNL